MMSNPLKRCEVCHNDYDKMMEIKIGGATHFFDSFECAIHGLAPICAHCGCRIIGHGSEAGAAMYCCAHCAQAMGHDEMKDRTAPIRSAEGSGTAKGGQELRR